jgi:hypothetical protein
MRGRVLRWSLVAAGISLTVMLMSVLLATAPDGQWARNQAREQVLRQHVGTLKRRLDEGIQARQTTLLTLARSPIDRERLEEVRRADGAYAWIGITDTSGRVLSATGGLLEGVDVSSRPWFLGARGGPFTADVHEAVLLANLLGGAREEPLRFFDISVAVTQEGSLVGVLGTHLYSEWLEEVARLPSAALQEVQGEVLLLSQDGTVQAGPQHLKGKRVIIDPATGKVTWPESGSFLWYAAPGGSRLAGARWTIVARAPPSPGALDRLLGGW